MDGKRLAQLVFSSARDLRSLAQAAGGDPKTFFRGADFRGADLRNEDLRGYSLEGANFLGATVDDTTKVDSAFQELLDAARPIRVVATLDIGSELKLIREQAKEEGRTVAGTIVNAIADFIRDEERRETQLMKHQEIRKDSKSDRFHDYLFLMDNLMGVEGYLLPKTKKKSGIRTKISFDIDPETYNKAENLASKNNTAVPSFCIHMAITYIRWASLNKKRKQWVSNNKLRK